MKRRTRSRCLRGAVEAHAEAVAVGADLEEEAGCVLPVGASPLEGEPQAGLVRGLVV